ncbi:hypothetical protein PGT21_036879 [Puccinia graminis f. sp. tritici]|uniref:Uncharacterized protein n=1 Tax=Puccinia graminis f. sp. tritici TaxID=56615 RepID=A0A5B0QQ82_PUCGR|nr:hypothetical protein PGT21_036879 [Puccinia graminis f. sp. tritici]
MQTYTQKVTNTKALDATQEVKGNQFDAEKSRGLKDKKAKAIMGLIEKLISHMMESKVKPGQDYNQKFSGAEFDSKMKVLDSYLDKLYQKMILNENAQVKTISNSDVKPTDELELDEEKNVHQFLKTLFENDNKQIFLALDKIEKSTVQALEGLENAPKIPINHTIRTAFESLNLQI